MAANTVYSVVRDKASENPIYENAFLAINDWMVYILTETRNKIAAILHAVALHATIEVIIFTMCLVAAHLALALASGILNTAPCRTVWSKILGMLIGIAHIIFMVVGAFFLYNYLSSPGTREVIRPYIAQLTGLQDVTIVARFTLDAPPHPPKIIQNDYPSIGNNNDDDDTEYGDDPYLNPIAYR